MKIPIPSSAALVLIAFLFSVASAPAQTGNEKPLATSPTILQPKQAPGGLRGWVDCTDGKTGRPLIVQGIPIGSTLILLTSGHAPVKIRAGKPIIEEWRFVGADHVVVKSRALHGPSLIERFTLSGTRAGSCLGYSKQAPNWAWGYLDN